MIGYKKASRRVQRMRLEQVCPDLCNMKNDLCKEEAKAKRAEGIAARAERRKAAKECRSKAEFKKAFDRDLRDVYMMETSIHSRDGWKAASYKAVKERQ